MDPFGLDGNAGNLPLYNAAKRGRRIRNEQLAHIWLHGQTHRYAPRTAPDLQRVHTWRKAVATADIKQVPGFRANLIQIALINSILAVVVFFVVVVSAYRRNFGLLR